MVLVDKSFFFLLHPLSSNLGDNLLTVLLKIRNAPAGAGLKPLKNELSPSKYAIYFSIHKCCLWMETIYSCRYNICLYSRLWAGNLRLDLA